jgi:hypothetical protein
MQTQILEIINPTSTIVLVQVSGNSYGEVLPQASIDSVKQTIQQAFPGCNVVVTQANIDTLVVITK